MTQRRVQEHSYTSYSIGDDFITCKLSSNLDNRSSIRFKSVSVHFLPDFLVSWTSFFSFKYKLSHCASILTTRKVLQPLWWGRRATCFTNLLAERKLVPNLRKGLRWQLKDPLTSSSFVCRTIFLLYLSICPPHNDVSPQEVWNYYHRRYC